MVLNKLNVMKWSNNTIWHSQIVTVNIFLILNWIPVVAPDGWYVNAYSFLE